MARNRVCIISRNPSLIRAGQEPPKYLKTILSLDELHPTVGNQPVVFVKKSDTRKVLNFPVKPTYSMALDTAFRPIKPNVSTLIGPLFGQVLV